MFLPSQHETDQDHRTTWGSGELPPLQLPQISATSNLPEQIAEVESSGLAGLSSRPTPVKAQT